MPFDDTEIVTDCPTTAVAEEACAFPATKATNTNAQNRFRKHTSNIMEKLQLSVRFPSPVSAVRVNFFVESEQALRKYDQKGSENPVSRRE